MVVSNQRADLNEVWNRDLCAVEVESTKMQLVSSVRGHRDWGEVMRTG